MHMALMDEDFPSSVEDFSRFPDFPWIDEAPKGGKPEPPACLLALPSQALPQLQLVTLGSGCSHGVLAVWVLCLLELGHPDA